MAFFIGRDREARRAYGFDEVALVPGTVTVNPEDTDVTTQIGKVKLALPFLASAMDGVVDVKFAIAMGKLGGLGVLNLDGINTRYDDPAPVYEKIAGLSKDEATRYVQEIYREPVKDALVTKRVKEIKAGGVVCAVSSIPQNAGRVGPLAAAAGADIFVVQGTVTTARFKSSKGTVIDLQKFCHDLKIPVIIGNTVTYQAALELMETGCAALLVGVGPGAACTSRGVLGLGVPQVTATVDCASARDFHYKKTGHYVSIITDGGMSYGGDICKAFACGADAVMVGSAFARSKEAPGKGFHWGMATPHHNLPRGTRIQVGTVGTLEEILLGPAKLDDGSQNLVGAVRTCMGAVGVSSIREMQLTEIIIAPEIKHEGKVFQQAQRVGMGK